MTTARSDATTTAPFSELALLDVSLIPLFFLFLTIPVTDEKTGR